jgi:hypothetical protein
MGPRIVSVAILGLLLASLQAPGLHAETITWATGASGSWYTVANWSPQDVPNETGEVAVIPASSGVYTVSIDSDLTLDAIHNDNAAGTLVINGRSLYLAGGLHNRGIFHVNWGTIDGPFENFGGGVVRIPAGMQFWHYAATLLNDGVIQVNSDQGSGAAIFLCNFNGTALEGTGVIELQTNGYYLDARFTGQGITQAAAHTIRGEGYIGANITNYGTISADHPGGRALVLADYSKTNHATIKATGGGVLRLATGVTQGPAGRFVADGGVVQLDALGAITGGTLETIDGGWIDLVSWPAFLTDVVNLGDVRIPGGMRLYASGSIENQGTIAVNSDQGSGDAYLRIEGPVSLTGAGEIVLQTAGSAVDARISGGQILTQASGHTIRGEGSILAPLVNNGTVIADHPGGRVLLLTTYDQVNNATMKATGGGRMEFAYPATNNGLVVADAAGTVMLSSGLFNNLGTLRADGGTVLLEAYDGPFNHGVAEAKGGGLVRAARLPGHYDAVTQSLTGGAWHVYANSTMRWMGMPVSTNAAEILLDGSGAHVYADDGTAEALALLAINAPEGSLVVRNGAGLTLAGNLQNAGYLAAGDGSTLSIAGAYTQTYHARTAVTGTLAAGSVSIVGGLLEGTGTVVADVTSASRVVPGTSIGTLTIDGDFTQTSDGWLLTEIAGTGPGEFDRLVVTGHATLGGRLLVPHLEEVDLIDGATVTVMTFDSRTGEFDEVIGCPGPMFCIDDVIYTDTTVSVVIRALDASSTEEPTPPTAVALSVRQAGPGAIVFALDLVEPAAVELGLFDISGRRAARIFQGVQPAGRQVMQFDGAGSLPSGIYFARAIVRSGSETAVRKGTLVFVR